ncbi:MAG: hypothetical protein IJ852_05715 [Alphaproteobacteria bacterium]|nr:hypothetical protein [Alphaproteobacteria bacterium]
MKKFIKQIIICLIFITSTFNVHAEENMVKNTKPLVVYFQKPANNTVSATSRQATRQLLPK